MRCEGVTGAFGRIQSCIDGLAAYLSTKPCIPVNSTKEFDNSTKFVFLTPNYFSADNRVISESTKQQASNSCQFLKLHAAEFVVFNSPSIPQSVFALFWQSHDIV